MDGLFNHHVIGLRKITLNWFRVKLSHYQLSVGLESIFYDLYWCFLYRGVVGFIKIQVLLINLSLGMTISCFGLFSYQFTLYKLNCF